MSAVRSSIVLLSFVVLGCAAAWGQPYPAKPVRVIVVFPAGGATDIVSRIVFQRISEQVNEQFLIDNRAGAAGMIGAEILAKSPPDGYTIMVYSQTFLANAHLYKKMAYDVQKDFAGIGTLTRIVPMLAVHPSMPVHSTKDLIDLAKARPDEIRYGSAGIGALQHLATSVLCKMTGVRMSHVPYKGGGPAVVALMSGEIHMILTPIAEVYTQVKAGRLRPIAVSSATRTKQFPDVPAIAETVKGYEFVSWFGTFAPAGTPKPIIDKLNAEIKKALADPDTAAKLSEQVLDPMYTTPEEFNQLLASEYARLKDVVALSGARLE